MKEMFRMVDKSKVDEVKQMLEYTQKGTAKATVGNYMVDHFDREPKKFETNEICSIMDTQITGWKRAGVHRFSKEGYGRQRSWIREGAEEEGGNEPDKDGFTKLTKAEQLELPFDLPDREKG